jgi:sec-independent protein translocase protein TatB
MFANVGWGEMLLLVVIGLVVLGPERLPGAIRWSANTLRQARDYLSGATSQLREELGPEFDDLREPLSELNKLRGMSPRAAITKHLLDGDDSLLSTVEKSLGEVKETVAETKADLIVPPAAAQRSPATPASEPPEPGPTRFDPDAT